MGVPCCRRAPKPAVTLGIVRPGRRTTKNGRGPQHGRGVAGCIGSDTVSALLERESKRAISGLLDNPII